ncbi:MAG: site-specific integrase [Deltaproteobacteria bacterium]|nr:site-specific integrase [Deltaproteobacteria bacterium]
MQIAEFLNSIAGLSLNTLRNYESTLWQVSGFIAGDEPTDDEIKEFLNPYCVASLHRHKAAIKAYLEFARPGQPWPFTRRQFAGRRQRVPRYIKPEAIESIAKAGDGEDDYMLVMTLFNLGCRISELMAIDERKITNTGVVVVTKGGDEKLKIITKDFYPTLKKYSKGKGRRVFPRPYSYYQDRLKKMGKKAGYPDISLHMIRHSRAVDLLNKGLSPPYLQQFLGHASFDTTAIYLQVDGGELLEQIEKVESAAKGGD